jgi:VanZ family protein
VKYVVYLAFLVLGILSARGRRWAYIVFVVAGLLYFPASVGFHLQPHPCQLIPTLSLAIYSLANYRHVILFVLFFIMTRAQFRRSHWSALAWAGVVCLAMGLLIEFSEGLSGAHTCRMRDLIPDSAGILIGAAIVFIWERFRKSPSVSEAT